MHNQAIETLSARRPVGLHVVHAETADTLTRLIARNRFRTILDADSTAFLTAKVAIIDSNYQRLATAAGIEVKTEITKQLQSILNHPEQIDTINANFIHWLQTEIPAEARNNPEVLNLVDIILQILADAQSNPRYSGITNSPSEATISTVREKRVDSKTTELKVQTLKLFDQKFARNWQPVLRTSSAHKLEETFGEPYKGLQVKVHTYTRCILKRYPANTAAEVLNRKNLEEWLTWLEVKFLQIFFERLITECHHRIKDALNPEHDAGSAYIDRSDYIIPLIAAPLMAKIKAGIHQDLLILAGKKMGTQEEAMLPDWELQQKIIQHVAAISVDPAFSIVKMLPSDYIRTEIIEDAQETFEIALHTIQINYVAICKLLHITPFKNITSSLLVLISDKKIWFEQGQKAQETVTRLTHILKAHLSQTIQDTTVSADDLSKIGIHLVCLLMQLQNIPVLFA